MNTSKLLLAVLVVAACGDDNAKSPDAPNVVHDTPVDMMPPPAPPALGTQVDRLGRPAINTALNHVFDTTAAGPAAKDAYNADGASGSWATNDAYSKEFSKNLAIFDSLDTGITGAGFGCGNAIAFNTNGTGSQASYGGLSGLLQNDQLFVDTAKGTCNLYLAIEVEVATGGAVTHTSCGGRAPSYDVIDVTYSAVAAGLQGFDAQFHPLVTDGASVHADVSDSAFPFLGAPHAP